MEDKLDQIEAGALSRLATLQEFYGSFRNELDTAREKMRNVKREEVSTDIICEKCGSPMVIKWGKRKRGQSGSTKN